MRAFSTAKKAGRFSGPNPVRDVERRKVARRAPSYLRAHEVVPVLVATPARWRPLFATAIYTGLRRGELLGLRKADVDLPARLLTVARSYDAETTKGRHAEVIPIAQELVPYLEEAVRRSASEIVFPAPDGSMLSSHTPLEDVLRRAMRRAGLVLGYDHACRKKGCAHREAAPDAVLRRCPKHGMKLWPKAHLRPLRFHDLRHTTASLLMMAGANPTAVQRILRHQDPRITTEVYGHLAPNYLRDEVDRLRFHAPEPPETQGDSAPLGPQAVQRLQSAFLAIGRRSPLSSPGPAPCPRDLPWYEFSMKSVTKVAVSLPVDTLKSLERVRVRLRKTRSGAVTEAIERWLQSEEVGDDERRYLEGYLRHPERAEESAALAGAVVATWERWE